MRSVTLTHTHSHARTHVRKHARTYTFITYKRTPEHTTHEQVFIFMKSLRRWAHVCIVIYIYINSYYVCFLKTITCVCVSCCKSHAKILRVKMAERVQMIFLFTIVIVPMEYSAIVVNVRMSLFESNLSCSICQCVYAFGVYI